MPKKQTVKPVPITFQLPPELHKLLETKAAEAGHTLQAEGIARMAASFGIEVQVRPRGRPWPKKAAAKKTAAK